jgi:hypothetical protein
MCFLFANLAFFGVCRIFQLLNCYICNNQIKQSTVLAKRKKKKMTPPAPDAFEKQRKALRRTHRQVIYLNDSELAAVKEYCRRFGLKGRSSIFRQATMERVLEELDESHPTLF